MLYTKSLFLIMLSSLLVPLAHAWGPGPWDAPAFNAPYSGGSASSFQQKQGMRIEKGVDEQGYVIRIHLIGIEPAAIEMQLVRGSLLLRSSQSSLSRQSGDYGERSFSRSFSFNRRIGLPGDADVSRMVRNDSPGLIEIRLPRRQWY